MHESTLSEEALNLTLFRQRGNKWQRSGTQDYCNYIHPPFPQIRQYKYFPISSVINTAITDAVISHFQELLDAKNVQAQEDHLNKKGLSLSILCANNHRKYQINLLQL